MPVFLFVRRARAGSFLEEDTLLVISSWLMSILIADKVQVYPHFVVATLISWTEAKPSIRFSCAGA